MRGTRPRALGAGPSSRAGTASLLCCLKLDGPRVPAAACPPSCLLEQLVGPGHQAGLARGGPGAAVSIHNHAHPGGIARPAEGATAEQGEVQQGTEAQIGVTAQAVQGSMPAGQVPRHGVRCTAAGSQQRRNRQIVTPAGGAPCAAPCWKPAVQRLCLCCTDCEHEGPGPWHSPAVQHLEPLVSKADGQHAVVAGLQRNGAARRIHQGILVLGHRACGAAGLGCACVGGWVVERGGEGWGLGSRSRLAVSRASS